MAETMSVQVRKSQLRNQPSFLGKIITELAYGDKVTVQEEKKSWVRVSDPKQGKEGWMHMSALTTKEIVLKPNSKDVEKAASSDEIALAGKGFNEQVEEKFKQENKSIDFSWIDRMEKIVISQQEKQSFLREGGLADMGGEKS